MIEHALSAARIELELGRYNDALVPLREVERQAAKHSQLWVDASLLRMRLALRLNEYDLLWGLDRALGENIAENYEAQFERELILNTALRDLLIEKEIAHSVERLAELSSKLSSGGGSSLYRALSRSFAKIGRAEEAVELAMRGLDLARTEQKIRAIGNAHLALGEALRANASEASAIEHYAEAIEIGLNIGNRDSELWARLGEACAYLQLGDLENASRSSLNAKSLTEDPEFEHPLETAHVRLIQALANILSKASVDLEGVLGPYVGLGILWPKQFISETLSRGELPRAIPI